MSQTNIAITQLAQVGLAERIAQETQGHPEVLRQAAQQSAPQELKHQKDAVGETERSETPRGIKADKDGKGGRDGGKRGGKRGPGRGPDGGPDGDRDGAANTPWAGNILNLKV